MSKDKTLRANRMSAPQSSSTMAILGFQGRSSALREAAFAPTGAKIRGSSSKKPANAAPAAADSNATKRETAA
jgi:hypothetical protein